MAKFYKIGKYEILLNNVDAVTEVYRNQHKHQFNVIVDGAEISIYDHDVSDLLKENKDIVKEWKNCIK